MGVKKEEEEPAKYVDELDVRDFIVLMCVMVNIWCLKDN